MYASLSETKPVAQPILIHIYRLIYIDQTRVSVSLVVPNTRKMKTEVCSPKSVMKPQCLTWVKKQLNANQINLSTWGNELLDFLGTLLLPRQWKFQRVLIKVFISRFSFGKIVFLLNCENLMFYLSNPLPLAARCFLVTCCALHVVFSVLPS